jgi:hypothetical protein
VLYLRRMRRDQQLIEGFLRAYDRLHGTSHKIVRRPEQSNRSSPAVEAVAADEIGRTVAFEHTLIEPFEGERSDTDRFLRVFAPLDGSATLMKPGFDVEVVARVGAIPTGVDWNKTAVMLRRHLGARIPALIEGRTTEMVPDAEFPLEITISVSAHDADARDHVWVSRVLPKIPIDSVVRRALERKVPKLVSEPADRRVLILEKADIARGLTETSAAIDRLAPELPLLKMVDEVWLAITYCIEPDDTVFFYELRPALGGRRLKLELFSSVTA